MYILDNTTSNNNSLDEYFKLPNIDRDFEKYIPQYTNNVNQSSNTKMSNAFSKATETFKGPIETNTVNNNHTNCLKKFNTNINYENGGLINNNEKNDIYLFNEALHPDIGNYKHLDFNEPLADMNNKEYTQHYQCNKLFNNNTKRKIINNKLN